MQPTEPVDPLRAGAQHQMIDIAEQYIGAGGAHSWTNIALTVAAVPTGMKAGVRIVPRGVVISPLRAAPSVEEPRMKILRQGGEGNRGSKFYGLSLCGIFSAERGDLHDFIVAAVGVVPMHGEKRIHENGDLAQFVRQGLATPRQNLSFRRAAERTGGNARRRDRMRRTRPMSRRRRLARRCADQASLRFGRIVAPQREQANVARLAHAGNNRQASPDQ